MPGGLHPPVDLVLAWQTDAFPHGIRRGLTLVVVVAAMYIITLCIVLGRIYARLFVQHSAGLDDLFISLAMVRKCFVEIDFKLHVLTRTDSNNRPRHLYRLR